MKSKFYFDMAMSIVHWDEKANPPILNSSEGVNRNINGDVSLPLDGICLYGCMKNKEVGVVIDGKSCYQLCLKEDFKYLYPPLGFWFRAPNYRSEKVYIFMTPKYDSHYKLNLARFYQT